MILIRTIKSLNISKLSKAAMGTRELWKPMINYCNDLLAQSDAFDVYLDAYNVCELVFLLGKKL